MRLHGETAYAFQSLAYLTTAGEGCWAPAHEIAQAGGIPARTS
jgi:DNA-binding IscR family transcriptional regulator